MITIIDFVTFVRSAENAFKVSACLVGITLCVTQNASSKDLELSIATEKQGFLAGEEVVVNIKCRNLTNAARAMQLLYYPHTLFFQVENDKGAMFAGRRGPWMRSSERNDDEIGSKETKDMVLTLDWIYGEPSTREPQVRYFRPGKYRARAFCIPIWGGDTISSNAVEFDVVQPSGDEQQAFAQYIRARESYHKFADAYSETIESLKSIIENHAKSVYRLGAYCILMRAFWYRPDSSSTKMYALRGIKEYPNALKTRELVGPLIFSMPTDQKMAYLDTLGSQFPGTATERYCKVVITGLRAASQKSGR